MSLIIDKQCVYKTIDNKRKRKNMNKYLKIFKINLPTCFISKKEK